MNRRNFLKKAFAGTSLLSLTQLPAAVASASRKLEASNDFKYIQSLPMDPKFLTTNVFEMVEFKPGTAVEFPLDFLMPGSEPYKATSYIKRNKVSVEEEEDFLCVRTFNYGGTGATPDEAKQAVADKIKREAMTLLYYAGLSNPMITGHNRAEVIAKMSRTFRDTQSRIQKSGRLLTFTLGEYIIGISQAEDCFVLPFREDLVAYPDRITNEWYAWMDCGLAVLNNKKVLLGRVV